MSWLDWTCRADGVCGHIYVCTSVTHYECPFSPTFIKGNQLFCRSFFLSFFSLLPTYDLPYDSICCGCRRRRTHSIHAVRGATDGANNRERERERDTHIHREKLGLMKKRRGLYWPCLKKDFFNIYTQWNITFIFHI